VRQFVLIGLLILCDIANGADVASQEFLLSGDCAQLPDSMKAELKVLDSHVTAEAASAALVELKLRLADSARGHKPGTLMDSDYFRAVEGWLLKRDLSERLLKNSGYAPDEAIRYCDFLIMAKKKFWTPPNKSLERTRDR